DIARNFAYKWDSVTDGAEYKGSAPYSELETKIARDWIAQNKNAFAFIDFHNTFGVRHFTYSLSPNIKLRKLYGNLVKTLTGVWRRDYDLDLLTQDKYF